MSAITSLLRIIQKCVKNTFLIYVRLSSNARSIIKKRKKKKEASLKVGIQISSISHRSCRIAVGPFADVHTSLPSSSSYSSERLLRTNVFPLKINFPVSSCHQSESQLLTTHRPPDFPANCNANMLFANPFASTPSSKSSRKHSATSRLSSCVGLTPPTCATRC
jgi:hypothetical protein